MTAPLRMSFDVACSAGHAFRVWTSGIASWWPPDHTVTGHPATVVLQAGVGGRIYERTGDGLPGRFHHAEVPVAGDRGPARLAVRPG
jgi:hypothetical protein